MRFRILKNNFIPILYFSTFALFPFLISGQQISTILLPLMVLVFIFKYLINKNILLKVNNFALIFLFLTINIIALINSYNLEYSIQNVIKLNACILVYLISLNMDIFLNGDVIKNIKKIMFYIIFTASIVSLILVYVYKVKFNADYVGINLSYKTEAGKNQFAFFMACIIPFCIFWGFKRNVKNTKNIILIVCSMILVITSVLIDSRGVIVSVTISILITSIFTKDKKLFANILILIIIISIFLYIHIKTNNDYGHISGYNSNSIRIILIKESLKTIMSNLGFGIGLGDFYQIAQSSGLPVAVSHNDYMQILVELGVVGFFIFICMIGMFIRKIISISDIVELENISFYKGIISSNISIIIYLMFINSYNILLVWFIFGISMAFYNNVKTKYTRLIK